MGIDIYLRWEGQTENEQQAQYCGFDVTKGHTGYLREAYHGGPYATKALMPEAFSHNCTEACTERECAGEPIPAATLRERLAETLSIVKEREEKLYQGDDKTISRVQKSFISFVELAEKMEKDTGKPIRIYASY